VIDVPLTEDSLKVAMRRIQDFASVHYGKGEYLEPLVILRESLGITDEMMEELSEWADELFTTDISGPLLLGVMMGLIASDHARHG
jgi:hypothetical protein